MREVEKEILLILTLAPSLEPILALIEKYTDLYIIIQTINK